MKVFTKSEIQFLEQCAAESGVKEGQLMEQAGSAVAAFLVRQIQQVGGKVILLCGKGNNGGDGFVCARRLAKNGFSVTVLLTQGQPATACAQEAFAKIGDTVQVLPWSGQKYEIEGLLETADVIIDAIFGFGFRGALPQELDRLVSYANKCKALRIAVDLPSGAECDTGKVEGACFKAHYTVAFTTVKPANVLYPSAGYCGKNVVAGVGIDKKLVNSLPATFSVLKEDTLDLVGRDRDSQSNKGDFGRLLMICGSYGMIGAAILAARAALRTGVGLLNLVASQECYPLLAAAIPEAVFTVVNFSTEAETKTSSDLLFAALQKATACVIGCGIGGEAARFVPPVLGFATCPVLIDADGLNFLAEHMEQIARRTSPLVVTPHPGEMARLTGRTIPQIQMDRLTTAKTFAKEHGVYTVLKGAGTLVASPEGEIFLNTTGNGGMAKGGSGDALAGIIGALLAEGLPPEQAAAAGVYLHGRAGDLAAEKYTQRGMLPTDLIECLPKVLCKIPRAKV